MLDVEERLAPDQPDLALMDRARNTQHRIGVQFDLGAVIQRQQLAAADGRGIGRNVGRPDQLERAEAERGDNGYGCRSTREAEPRPFMDREHRAADLRVT